MKNQIKKYLEQILRGVVTGVSIFTGISICMLSIYAFDWSGVSSVTSGTTLTANLWNTTMSTITGSIQTLENSMVSLTGDQTIYGTKTFTGAIFGKTPTATNELATKAYVDNVVIAAGGGFSTCSTTDATQIRYECNPDLPACSTDGAYCGGGKVAGIVGGRVIISALSDEDVASVEGLSWESAFFGACGNKEVAGFGGWTLPNKTELSLLYNKKTIIGGFLSNRYWSSTDYYSRDGYGRTLNGDARSQNLSSGTWANWPKNTRPHLVRCIRKY